MNKKYNLFLDDIRDVKMVYKNLIDDDFKALIIENGLPELK